MVSFFTFCKNQFQENTSDIFLILILFTKIILHLISVQYTMDTTEIHNQRIASMTFTSVYPHYVAKVQKKGRTKEELHEVIEWLTGYDDAKLLELLNEKATFETFFKHARLNPNAALITGMICGYRIEEIKNSLTRQVRYLDKLVDELAKGRPLEKIFR